MKTRFLMLLAALLLGTASAFAQSGNNEPMKGDVNGDGKVDVADITAVIKIMKDGGGTSEETKQYWYVGFGDLPTSVSNIKTSASETGWHYFTAGTTELHVGPLSNDTKVYWFVLVPENSGLENVVDAGEVLGGYTNSTVTIGGTSYTKITQDNASKKFDYDMIQQTQNQQYWYAGQTQPSSMTSNPTVDDTNFTNNKWHTLNGNQISQTIKGGTAGNSWYVAVPTSKGFKYYDSTLTEIDETAIKLSAISINNVSYDVWKSNSTGAKTNVYMKTQQQTYYWYAGQTQPTSQASVTAQDSGTFTNNNWHTINVNNNYSFSNPIYNSESNPISGSSNTNWYVALPADKSYGIYDSDDVNDINVGNWTEQSQITVANVNYKVYKKVSGSRKFAAYWIH